MTEPTKQQQRERAERRRKLEEFWRWVLSEKPDLIRIKHCANEMLPTVCVQAITMARNELFRRNERTSGELARYLSLAQLDVLEMLEERVGASTVSIDLGLSDAEQEEFSAIKPFTYDPRKVDNVTNDVVSIGGRSSGKTERIAKATSDGAVAVRVPYERLQHPLSKPYNPRKDLFPPPPPVLMSRHPWELD